MIDGHMNYTPAEMAAAYALLNDKAKCFSYLKKVVEKQELMKFDIKEWPVFENITMIQNSKKLLIQIILICSSNQIKYKLLNGIVNLMENAMDCLSKLMNA